MKKFLALALLVPAVAMAGESADATTQAATAATETKTTLRERLSERFQESKDYAAEHKYYALGALVNFALVDTEKQSITERVALRAASNAVAVLAGGERIKEAAATGLIAGTAEYVASESHVAAAFDKVWSVVPGSQKVSGKVRHNVNATLLQIILNGAAHKLQQ